MSIIKDFVTRAVDRHNKATVLLNKFEAWEEKASDILGLKDTVTKLDKKVSVLDGKLDVILNFFDVPKKKQGRNRRTVTEYACKS